jgi:uncharacterized protein
MSKRIDFERAEPILEAVPTLIAAWVFGSAQQGLASAGSDIDIGLLMEAPPSLDEQLELLAKLQGALEFEHIDLVILNEANPILRFEAISGRPLICRDLSRRAEFASLTAREYEDEMAFWQRALQ